MADKKRLQGIALILFGILLCLAKEEINRELFHSIGCSGARSLANRARSVSNITPA